MKYHKITDNVLPEKYRAIQQDEFKKNFEEGKHFIIAYKTLWQIYFNKSKGLFLATKIHYFRDSAYTKRGRMFYIGVEYASEISGCSLSNS